MMPVRLDHLFQMKKFRSNLLDLGVSVMGAGIDEWNEYLRRQGKIPNTDMTFGEVLEDSEYLRAGDVIAYTADDAWAAFVPVRKVTVGAVRERFGADFVILMSDDGRYDRHVMRRFAATRVAYKRGCHYVNFFKSVYQPLPTNFYR